MVSAASQRARKWILVTSGATFSALYDICCFFLYLIRAHSFCNSVRAVAVDLYCGSSAFWWPHSLFQWDFGYTGLFLEGVSPMCFSIYQRLDNIGYRTKSMVRPVPF